MRTIYHIGVATQVIIVIISLVLKDHQIVKYGNLALLSIAIIIVGSGVRDATSWEIAEKEEGEEKVLLYPARLFLKYLLFILPSLVVMLIYYISNGFSLWNQNIFIF